jgi:mono/diheme cytochrome c family protein
MRISSAIAWVTFVAVTFAQSAGATVWDGVFTDEQVKRGMGAYERDCASCHGSHGVLPSSDPRSAIHRFEDRRSPIDRSSDR